MIAASLVATFVSVMYSISTQDFRTLRELNMHYVDKSEHICRLASIGRYLFLSRPRRFGKSLTVSTLNELYSNSTELFKGLWAEEHWDFAAKQRPVLWFKFASAGYQTGGLQAALLRMIAEQAQQHGLEISTSDNVGQCFKGLIQAVAKTHPSGRVVILVDEYDKPIIDYLDDIPRAEANRDELRGFYGVLKDADPYIELVFITGVSAFSKVSLFSDLNNLRNLTLHQAAYTLVGITQTELEANFGPQLDATGVSRDEVRSWYNGYAWGEHERVYNPWSILQFLESGMIQNFWADSGTPTFVTDLLAQGGNFDVAPAKVRETELLTFNLGALNPVAILFQGGYLTIKEDLDSMRRYTLDYPNEEVRQTFMESLLVAYSFSQPISPGTRIDRLFEAFNSRELPAVMQIIDTSLAAVPYQLWQRQSEAMFHAILHTTFSVLGLYTSSEVSSARGRADIVVEVPKYIYIIELKLGGTAADALAQIEARGYTAPYADDAREVIKLGIAFDVEARKVREWVEG